MQRTIIAQEFRCKECDLVFLNEKDHKDHFHSVQKVSDNVYVILLPPGIEYGTWEAAKSFSQSVEELKNKCSDKKFSFIPFEEQSKYQQNSIMTAGVVSMLAISN